MSEFPFKVGDLVVQKDASFEKNLPHDFRMPWFVGKYNDPGEMVYAVEHSQFLIHGLRSANEGVIVTALHRGKIVSRWGMGYWWHQWYEKVESSK